MMQDKCPNRWEDGVSRPWFGLVSVVGFYCQSFGVVILFALSSENAPICHFERFADYRGRPTRFSLIDSAQRVCWSIFFCRKLSFLLEIAGLVEHLPQLLPVPLLSLRVPAHAQTKLADHRADAFTSLSSAIKEKERKKIFAHIQNTQPPLWSRNKCWPHHKYLSINSLSFQHRLI